MTQDDVRQLVLKVRSRAKNKDQRDLLVRALRCPALVSARMSTEGILLRGPLGSATLHFTASDVRALRNARSCLRRAGLDV